MATQDLKKLLERIHLRLDESFVGISGMVADLAPADLAELFNQLTVAEAATVVTMLPVSRVIEVFDQPTMRRRAAILEQIDPARSAEILSGLSADERTDIIQQMGLHERRRVLPKLSEELRAELEDLLQYPPHTAGGIMTTEFVRLDREMTVGEALKHIRSVAREKESIYACYVLEPGTGHLLGAVSLRDLVMAELDRAAARGDATQAGDGCGTGGSGIGRAEDSEIQPARRSRDREGRKRGWLRDGRRCDRCLDRGTNRRHLADGRRRAGRARQALLRQSDLARRAQAHRLAVAFVCRRDVDQRGASSLRSRTGGGSRAVFFHSVADRHRRQCGRADCDDGDSQSVAGRNRGADTPGAWYCVKRRPE